MPISSPRKSEALPASRPWFEPFSSSSASYGDFCKKINKSETRVNKSKFSTLLNYKIKLLDQCNGNKSKFQMIW